MRESLLLLFALTNSLAQQFPKSFPQLDPPRAGADVVTGKAPESGWPIRVKIFDAVGNLVQQRDVLVNSADSSIVAGFSKSLEAGQIVQASFLVAQSEMMGSAPLIVAPAPASQTNSRADSETTQPAESTDLGRVRYYFTSGVILSNDQGFRFNSGTQAGLFLGLNADRAWLPLNNDGFRRFNINSYLDARLTSVPTQQAASPGITVTSTLDAFKQSQKAASFQSGVYLPVIAGQPWSTGKSSYSLFAGPLAQAAFVTLTGDAGSNSPATPITGQFFKSYSYGARLGVFEHYRSSSAAPALISYVDFTVGRFGDFEAFRDLTLDAPSSQGHEFERVRPWRYSIEGVLKVPRSPFLLGFNANLGIGAWTGAPRTPPFTQPRDDLRFLFGAQFDFARLLKTIPEL